MRKLDFQHAKALFTDMCDHALLLPGLAPGQVTTSLHALRLILKPISSANLPSLSSKKWPPGFYPFTSIIHLLQDITGPTVTIVTSDFNLTGSSRWRMACRATEPFTLRRSLTTEGVMSLAWPVREPPLGCWGCCPHLSTDFGMTQGMTEIGGYIPLISHWITIKSH